MVLKQKEKNIGTCFIHHRFVVQDDKAFTYETQLIWAYPWNVFPVVDSGNCLLYTHIVV